MECTQGLIVGGGGKTIPQPEGKLARHPWVGLISMGGGREKCCFHPLSPPHPTYRGVLWGLRDDVGIVPYIRVEPCAVHRIFHQFRGRIFLCGGLDKRGCIVYSNSS